MGSTFWSAVWASFRAFNCNAVSHFLYLLQSNLFFLLMMAGVIGTVALGMKEQVDHAANEEQRII